MIDNQQVSLHLNKVFDKIICINLKKRLEKRDFIKKQAKEYDLDIEFFDAIEIPENPAKGCLKSHLNILKQAKKDKLNNILILEDDCKFLKKCYLPEIPTNWDMLYIGGNINAIYDYSNPNWIKGTIWTTHSYAISHKIFDKLITNLEKYEEEVDKYYVYHIHPNYNCYIIKDFLTTQKEGFSDIMNRNTNYNLDKLHAFKPIDFAKYTIEDNGNYRLKLTYPDSDLPLISIVTPTRNRKSIFNIWISNYNRINYPQNKIEFVIIDDGSENLSNILPKDIRIKYIKVNTEENKALSMGYKRNLCMKYSSHDIIVHMDDDDYYPSHSVKTRVKILLQNKERGCVGCTKIGCYHLNNKSSFMVGEHGLLDFSEATMAYTRNFYNDRKYDNRIKTGESKLFLRGRTKQILQIPFIFIIIALTHKTNITKQLRNINTKFNKNDVKFEDFISDDFKDIISKIKQS